MASWEHLGDVALAAGSLGEAQRWFHKSIAARAGREDDESRKKLGELMAKLRAARGPR